MYSEQTRENREKLVVPLFGIVVYPKSRTKLMADKVTGEILLNEMKNAESVSAIGLTVKSGTKASDLSEDSLYKIGNLLKITFIQPADDGYLVVAKAIQRVEAVSIYRRDGLFYATYSPVYDVPDFDEDTEAEVMASIKETIYEISKKFQGSEQFTRPIEKMESIDQIIGFVMPYIPVKLAEKQRLLELASVRERYLLFLHILTKHKENVNFQIEMAKKVTDRISKSNREAMLREQLKIIQEELNEGDDSASGDAAYRERIENSKMPDEVKKKALSELKKLETGGNHNPEANIIRNYLDLLLDLPWVTEEKKSIDIAEARRVLESNHYGLEKVKERIIQHLAVMKLKKEKQGSILLLVGPPGTGKTSLGKSIADALGRKYVRVSLGGVKDEAEIRGHRRTYIGALPGRIIQGMRKAGTKNPVFILDEVDKLSASYSGDPASALLEVLDPEQNSTFSDHYLEVPYDLSDVLFIATANSMASIPWPLLDRMETIEISGYTKNEKLAIAKAHLLPYILEEHGLDAEKLKIEDEALKVIIDRYTREAGVRGLKKQLAKIARFVSEKIVSGKADLPYVVRVDMLKEILGKEIIRQEEARKENVPGVVTGLAWTPVGGDILFIEGTFMPGTGKLTLTGQLGDVMKESAKISLSLVRSRLANTVNSFDFTSSDIHIHVPSGATPKDGPSAGVTLFTALTSLITGKAVDPKLAMTGEVTLSGAVLPVGGIKEKVLAAHRAGIKKVILPKENERDLEDVPEDVRNELKFIPVETIEEVLKEALDIDLPRPVASFPGNTFAPAHNA
ncbi:ATP-dependent Lon protease [Methanosarcina thermophila]|jgi:ATP-dependent Lon protease|uniref:Lon protease n=3 Tax=Methanosarcina thermophila TaxID=2210 RepID=A0A1I7AK21_METTE|nr:endopeptidase La [Methanosarcina thermophila]ALK05980.1 MAG: ATPase AAA [Methanosarcina sp. 795]AKB12447.1 ATP-dependent protease La Type I [Methanosarcina thermophila TM-1]AKB14349.1 ATP-dependent protease La Type I [Methanosarcina thermophila CHTI-55]NLU57899.1 endopeptidase La [Methanosarcina thermophila]SFT75185.1 ATP-dependent Lon protease [Methanosarcina thermophila]